MKSGPWVGAPVLIFTGESGIKSQNGATIGMESRKRAIFPDGATVMSADQRVHTTLVRVRYSETDQMGTFYNSRALEWFECGRTEYLRALGCAYTEMERRGVLLPVIEAHVHYTGKARYDDRLKIATSAQLSGKARLRFDIAITQVEDEKEIARGYTIHAFVDPSGRPIRPPAWLVEVLTDGGRNNA